MAKQALEGTRLNAFAMEPEKLVIVGFDTKDGAEHPLWDDRVKKLKATMTEEWIEGIIAFGVLEAVLVRKNGDRVEVVVGRRRVLGARIANQRLIEAGREPLRVPVMVRRGKDTDVMGAMMAENSGRVDDGPLICASKAARYMNRGMSEKEAAVALGVKVPYLKHLLKLLDLDDSVQKMVDARELALNTALTLSDLPREEQVKKASELVEKKVTVAEARRQTKLRKAKKEGRLVDEAAMLPISAAKCNRLAADSEFLSGLSPDARHLLHAITGHEPARKRVPGLEAALKRLEA